MQIIEQILFKQKVKKKTNEKIKYLLCESKKGIVNERRKTTFGCFSS